MFTVGDVVASKRTHAAWLASVAREAWRTRYLDSLPPEVALEVIEADYLTREGERLTTRQRADMVRTVRRA